MKEALRFGYGVAVAVIRCLNGGPGRSPTCDLRVRSALLYATELPGHSL